MTRRSVRQILAALRNRPASDFARNAGVVMTGTFLAQALPLLFYPIFTRIYTPANFGTFATIATLSATLAIVASGTYEQAFLLIRSESRAAHLFRHTMLRSAVVLLIFQILAVIGREPIAAALDDPDLYIALLVVPLISFGQVLYNCTSEWLVRGRSFKLLTGTRILQSSFLASSKLGFGLAGGAGSGLVWGEAMGRLLYIAYCFVYIWIPPLRRHRVNRRSMLAAGRRFRNFPRLMVPDQLINTLSGSVHVLIIGYAFGPTELGYVALLFSALYLPITIISSSVKDVFRHRVSLDFAESGNCRPLYLKVIAPVIGIGLAGFGLLYFIAPYLFGIVFGPDWIIAGQYAKILIPLFFITFVAMSMSGVLVIAEKMNVSLRWQILNLLLTTASLVFGILITKTVEGTLASYALVRSVSYLHYIGLSYKYAKRET